MTLLPFDVPKIQAKRLARIESSTTDEIRIQITKVNARWLREFMAYEPAADFPAITLPVLAITGEKDIQVPVADLGAMVERLGGPVETHAIPDLTHLLRRDPNRPRFKGYRKQMAQPTDAEVIDLVVAWIRALAPAGSS